MLIAQYINHFAGKSPAAPAIIHNGRPISYSAFAEAISRTSTEISSYRVQSPGTAAISMRNLADCWVTTLALQARGYITICVSSLESLESLQVKDLAGLFLNVGENGDPPGCHDSVATFFLSKPEYEQGVPARNTVIAERSHECGHILYTSGTTGHYKKCLLTARTQQARDRQRCEYYRWDKDTRFHGLNFGLWTSIGYNLPPSVWSVGGCVLFDQQDDCPAGLFDSDPSFVFLLPDQALQLCEAINPRFLKAETRDNLVLHVGGGFLSNRVAEKLRKNVCKNIVITYGSSEINSASFEQPYQSMEDLSWITPTGNRVVEIVNEQDNICLKNETGHLRIRLTELDIQQYLDDPAASTCSFRDGYFYPGDMAVQREDGKFRILGRMADVVNLGGQKCPVGPIEANLQIILQVDYVCIFSGIDSSGETVIVIAMETSEPPEQDRINHVGQELSQWGNVRFAYISLFPRTPSGTRKIDRKRLRELIFPD